MTKPRGVPQKLAQALKVYAQGDLSIRQVAARCGIAQSTLAKAVADSKREREAAPEDECTC